MLPIHLQKNLFIDHLVLTITDAQRTKGFYSKIFGEPAMQTETAVMYVVGPTRLFLTMPGDAARPNDKFDPKRVGLEHFAFNVKSVEELKVIEKVLDEGGIVHSGIHPDNHSQKEKIWLDDPDKIRVELFT